MATRKVKVVPTDDPKTPDFDESTLPTTEVDVELALEPVTPARVDVPEPPALVLPDALAVEPQEQTMEPPAPVENSTDVQTEAPNVVADPFEPTVDSTPDPEPATEKATKLVAGPSSFGSQVHTVVTY